MMVRYDETTSAHSVQTILFHLFVRLFVMANVEIDRISGKISFFDFLEHYLIPNRPCVIDQTLCEDWEAINLWQRNGVANFEYLHKHFGELWGSPQLVYSLKNAKCIVSCVARLLVLSPHPKEKQVDVVLPLKTRRPAAITELITHA